MAILDKSEWVTVGRRDLFDAVLNAVRGAMLGQGSRNDDHELYSDARDRAEECLRDLYESELLIKQKPDGGDMADGGPAFGEFQQVGECSVKTGGMSLRDYFAAKALQGLIAGSMADGSRWDKEAETLLPMISYQIADAMLAERAK